MNYDSRNSILKANFLFLFLGLLLFVYGSLVQSREIYSGLLITEYIIILLPNLFYLKLSGLSLRESLKLNKISLKQVAYIFLISIFSYPIGVFLNNIVLLILSLFGDMVHNTVPIPDNPKLYFISIIIIAISPGICEEIMFRGTIMQAYDRLGRKKAIIFSALLFGLFHINLQNLLGPVFLGLVFGIVVYRTNSIYSSILGHFLNNAIAMTIGYFALRGQEGLNTMETMEMIEALEVSLTIQLLSALLVTGALALVSFMILRKLLKNLPRTETSDPREDAITTGCETSLESDSKEVGGRWEGLEVDRNLTSLERIPLLISLILYLLINSKFLYI